MKTRKRLKLEWILITIISTSILTTVMSYLYDKKDDYFLMLFFVSITIWIHLIMKLLIIFNDRLYSLYIDEQIEKISIKKELKNKIETVANQIEKK